MKIFLFLLLVASNISCGQPLKSLSSHDAPVIFFSGESDGDKKLQIDFLYTKTFVKDTSINGAEFTKFRWDKFKNYKDVHEVYYEFERITDEEYVLLNEKLETLQNLKLKPEEQNGVLYGNKGDIGYEYVDTRTYSPKSKFVPDALSPIKFFLKEDKSVFIYVEIRPAGKKIETSQNKNKIKRALTGGAFDIASRILTRNDSIKAAFDLQAGDELQFVYTSEMVEFSSKGTVGEDSSFTGEQKKLPSKEKATTLKCTGVKKENGKRIFSFEIKKSVPGKSNPENSFSQIEINKEGDITMDNQIIGKEIMYKLDFKIDSVDASLIPEEYKQSVLNNFFSFTGITYDTLSGKAFPKALYINSANYYQMYYLTYFPIPYMEYTGTTGRITCVKLKGKEYGKRE